MNQNEERFILALIFASLWLAIHLYVPYLTMKLSDKTIMKLAKYLKPMTIEEEGKIYEQIFKIKKWKKFLPDGGKYFKDGFEKKKLKSRDCEYLQQFIRESYIAELTHWFIIVHVFLFLFWPDPIIFWIMLIYISIENLPCIMAQRYNRPRIEKYLKRKKIRNQVSQTKDYQHQV